MCKIYEQKNIFSKTYVQKIYVQNLYAENLCVKFMGRKKYFLKFIIAANICEKLFSDGIKLMF